MKKVIMAYKGKHRRRIDVQETMMNIVALILVAPAIAVGIVSRWFFKTKPRKALLFLLTFILCFCLVNALQYAYYNPSLKQGYVVAKSYSDGHPYSVSTVIGNYEFVKWYRDQPERFSVQVRAGNFLDWWEVSKSEWDAINEGDFITK